MINKIYFGKYKILALIGKGGMSTVFLAENIKLGNKWAIKRIRKKDSIINRIRSANPVERRRIWAELGYQF